MKKVIDFIIEHWEAGLALSPFLYELIVRLFPSKKDYTWLKKFFVILDSIIPNLERGADGKIRRKRNLSRIIIFFVLSAGLGNYVNAQNPVNIFGKGFYSYQVTDTTFVQASRTSMQNLYGNNGTIYFDKTRNKWRAWNGSAYVNLISSATGTIGGSIAATQVAYGSGANAIKGEAGFTYTEGSDLLTSGSLAASTLSSGLVLFTGGSGLLQGEPAMAYDAGTDMLSVVNETISTALNLTYVAATRIPYAGTSGLVTSEASLSYNETTNSILLSNPANTFTTSLFGGEIQMADIAGSDNITINDEGIQFSGSATNEIASDSDLEFNVTDDIFLVTTPDAGTTTDPILTRDAATGEIEVVASSAFFTHNVYTPTYNIVANIDAITVYNLSYMSVGNYYQISGQVGIDVTAAATLTSFEISIPIAGTVVTNSAGGTGCSNTSTCFAIDEDSTGLQATFTSSATTTNEVYNFTVGYTLLGI